MKPFQKALLSGLSALVATISATQAQEALGTINIVQVAAQVKIPLALTETTSLGGQITDKVDFKVSRANSRTIIEELASTTGSGYPVGTPVAGWNVVEVFDNLGADQGFFAYKPGFAPVPLPADLFSVTLPLNADSFESFITVSGQVKGNTITQKDNHYFTGDFTGTFVIPISDTATIATAFTGSVQSTNSLRNVGPRTNPLPHNAVVRKGTFSGSTATYSVTGSFTSLGNGALVSIQAFVDAGGAAPTNN